MIVDRDDDTASLAVADEGQGVAPQDLQRIFRRFERADEHTEGLGLGLHVVCQIADAHGGEVSAERNPSGPGTRFVLALPARR